MADERQAPAGREAGEESRNGRRRYFRRRQQPGRPAREGGPREGNNGRENSGARDQETPPARRRGAERRVSDRAETRNPRLGRRRRRTRTNGPASPRPEVIGTETVDLTDYRPPTSVFIYTHVSRPGSGWDSYEFRAEHFTKGGRTLDDFQIDLSKLYLDGVLSSTAQSESDK